MIRRLLPAFALVSIVFVEPASAANKKDKDSYSVELKAGTSYKKGVEGTVELVLTPKNGHHVNPDYPAKLTLTEVAGITFPKKILKKTDGDFKETLGTMKVPFTAASAGKQKIAGVFQFSVCSDKNCFMEKAELDVEVDVK